MHKNQQDLERSILAYLKQQDKEGTDLSSTSDVSKATKLHYYKIVPLLEELYEKRVITKTVANEKSPTKRRTYWSINNENTSGNARDKQKRRNS